jgi:hypothetical protein
VVASDWHRGMASVVFTSEMQAVVNEARSADSDVERGGGSCSKGTLE